MKLQMWRLDNGLTELPHRPATCPQALAEAIIKLSQMPKEEPEAMGCRGREYVEKYHSIPVLADKLESCLKEVIE